MKVLLLTVLVLLACTTQVFTLQCYTCADENDKICKTVTSCASSAGYCKTAVQNNALSRTCEEFCAEDFFTTCCQEDLC